MRIEVATVVDHIMPHKGDNTLFWDRDNWQSLCKRFHNIPISRSTDLHFSYTGLYGSKSDVQDFGLTFSHRF